MHETREFLRQFYWALRRPPPAGRQAGVARHILGVLPGLLTNATRLHRRLRRSGDRRRSIAIALLEHMGDIVAAEPVARLARRQFPDARIVWVTRAPFASIPASYPEVDEVAVVGCLTEWMLLRRFGLFDVVWDLHVANRVCPHCRVPQVKPGVVLNENNYYDHGHLLAVACLNAGLAPLDDSPVLVPPPAAAAWVGALSLPRRTIVVHCTSSVAGRDWPADKWADLLARILAAEPGVCIVEIGLRPLAVTQDGPRQISLCGKLRILETAEVIRRAELFIGIDSGPAHLAHAVGTPGVILLGAYGGFQRYTPYSGGYGDARDAVIVRTPAPVAALEVTAVFTAVMTRLAATDAAALRATSPVSP